MKSKPMIRWMVKHTNGSMYEVYLPKMSRKKVRECMIQDAKSDGTDLAWFRERKDLTLP